jgi:hypothetical protein
MAENLMTGQEAGYWKGEFEDYELDSIADAGDDKFDRPIREAYIIAVIGWRMVFLMALGVPIMKGKRMVWRNRFNDRQS